MNNINTSLLNLIIIEEPNRGSTCNTAGALKGPLAIKRVGLFTTFG